MELNVRHVILVVMMEDCRKTASLCGEHPDFNPWSSRFDSCRGLCRAYTEMVEHLSEVKDV